MTTQKSILTDIKNEFQKDNMINKLIMINLGVFVLVGILGTLAKIFSAGSYDSFLFTQWLGLPNGIIYVLKKPWTIITYMFLHTGFLHILFNMLWLFWIGNILQEYIGKKKILPIYLLGGIVGGLLYILAFNLFPLFEHVPRDLPMEGASAGVMAIVIATATLLPDHTIRLLFIGNVKLKWLALAFLVIDIISVQGGNAGGHIAHLGGALLGFFFIKQLQAGYDWSKGINGFLDGLSSLFSSKKSNLTFEKSTKTKAT